MVMTMRLLKDATKNREVQRTGRGLEARWWMFASGRQGEVNSRTGQVGLFLFFPFFC